MNSRGGFPPYALIRACCGFRRGGGSGNGCRSWCGGFHGRCRRRGLCGAGRENTGNKFDKENSDGNEYDNGKNRRKRAASIGFGLVHGFHILNKNSRVSPAMVTFSIAFSAVSCYCCLNIIRCVPLFRFLRPASASQPAAVLAFSLLGGASRTPPPTTCPADQSTRRRKMRYRGLFFEDRAEPATISRQENPCNA